MQAESCPCQSGQSFTQCCGRWLSEKGSAAPTAEALMRSRYSAFALSDIDYLLRTLEPEQHAADERQQLQQALSANRWLGLRVLDCVEGQANQAYGEVEFIAFYESLAPSTTSGIGQLHERSRFRRREGHWYYVDGDMLAPLPLSKNAPCVCGSGKKFKRCHGG